MSENLEDQYGGWLKTADFEWNDSTADRQNCIHFIILSVGSDEPVDVELPNQWLWDIIDEFIYQVCK